MSALCQPFCAARLPKSQWPVQKSGSSSSVLDAICLPEIPEWHSWATLPRPIATTPPNGGGCGQGVWLSTPSFSGALALTQRLSPGNAWRFTCFQPLNSSRTHALPLSPQHRFVHMVTPSDRHFSYRSFCAQAREMARTYVSQLYWGRGAGLCLCRVVSALHNVLLEAAPCFSLFCCLIYSKCCCSEPLSPKSHLLSRIAAVFSQRGRGMITDQWLVWGSWLASRTAVLSCLPQRLKLGSHGPVSCAIAAQLRDT